MRCSLGHQVRRSGFKRSTAASSSFRFGSFIKRVSDPRDEFLFGKPALSSTTVAQRIDKREKFIEERIAQGSRGNRLVQRLESDAALFAFCKSGASRGRRYLAGEGLAGPFDIRESRIQNNPKSGGSNRGKAQPFMLDASQRGASNPRCRIAKSCSAAHTRRAMS